MQESNQGPKGIQDVRCMIWNVAVSAKLHNSVSCREIRQHEVKLRALDEIGKVERWRLSSTPFLAQGDFCYLRPSLVSWCFLDFPRWYRLSKASVENPAPAQKGDNRRDDDMQFPVNSNVERAKR